MKSCVLFSGGWDSAACVLKYYDQKPDILFFNYGQTYLYHEQNAAERFARFFELRLQKHQLPLCHDMPRRNFYFISEAKRLRYGQVILGSRNLIPAFDKYKDSNFLSLKLFGYLMGMDVRLPISGWTKSRVVNLVKGYYGGALYNCYNNGDNIYKCHCPNCKEMQKNIIYNAVVFGFISCLSE